ncbi:MAG TPA: helix-turn-helix domain-containing protein [Flexivirga sp.]|uniref:PucR family transcriptional regulator n=1 Tax=Flexivirga sp. TaxID=1962927 RepID=UPI002B95A845|nr:helix-turn-helix domain-containing protein [Flexivirga sp.]HWC23822.1 helix-turn-helix domain-containing protein [Flexivirga sp.]
MHTTPEPLPALRPAVRELFRTGAREALNPSEEELALLHEATLAGYHSDRLALDPTLTEAARVVNVQNLQRWAASNISDPGQRVTPQLSAEAITLSRDLVRRGLDSRALDSYRTAQSAAWRLWMRICFTLTTDAAELQELLDVSALSISTFLDDTVEALTELMQADIEDLTRGTNAERMATLTLILEGAPITRAQAELRLRYQLTGEHVALVLWANAPASDDAPEDVAGSLEAVADAFMQASRSTRRLTLVAGAQSLWLWLPVKEVRADEGVTAALEEAPTVRVAIGRKGLGLEGFRRSHLDATETQRLVARIDSDERITRYTDVQLVALLTGDLTKADEFVADNLGGLATADPELRDAVSAYIGEQFNASRTAQRLYTHRNTVLRRLERADRLMPQPLGGNVTNVAAALEIVRLRPNLR